MERKEFITPFVHALLLCLWNFVPLDPKWNKCWFTWLPRVFLILASAFAFLALFPSPEFESLHYVLSYKNSVESYICLSFTWKIKWFCFRLLHNWLHYAQTFILIHLFVQNNTYIEYILFSSGSFPIEEVIILSRILWSILYFQFDCTTRKHEGTYCFLILT